MVELWNGIDTVTFFAFCSSQMTRMSLTWQMKILISYGRCKICLKFWTRHFQSFTALLTSGHRRSNCIVQRKGHFLTIYIQETQMFWDQNLQTLWQDWIHLWYDSLFGQKQTVNCATPDCNSRDSIRTDKENTRSWPQTIYGQLLLLPRLTR